MKNIINAILFTAGLLLAGSDGQFFPWANILGLGAFGLLTVRAIREERTHECR